MLLLVSQMGVRHYEFEQRYCIARFFEVKAGDAV